MLKEMLGIFQKIRDATVAFGETAWDFFSSRFGLKEIPKTEYTHTEKDYKVIKQTHEIVINHFGEDIYLSISPLEPHERISLCDHFIEDLKRLYGFDIAAEYYFDAESLITGYYDENTDHIYLNSAYLLSGTERGIRIFIGTIIHEMRHKIQRLAIDKESYWDISNKTRNTWNHEYANYISSEADIEMYTKQQIEIDARSFSEKSMEGLT